MRVAGRGRVVEKEAVWERMVDWDGRRRGAMAVVRGRRVAGEKNCRTIEPTIVNWPGMC